MIRVKHTLFCVAAFCFATIATRSYGQEITPSEFSQLKQQLIAESSTGLWRSIDWKISLLEAQHIAVKEQKPIFIWAMDGHPLGCT